MPIPPESMMPSKESLAFRLCQLRSNTVSISSFAFADDSVHYQAYASIGDVIRDIRALGEYQSGHTVGDGHHVPDREEHPIILLDDPLVPVIQNLFDDGLRRLVSGRQLLVAVGVLDEELGLRGIVLQIREVDPPQFRQVCPQGLLRYPFGASTISSSRRISWQIMQKQADSRFDLFP